MANRLLSGYKAKVTSVRESIMKKFLISILIYSYSIWAFAENLTTCHVDDPCLYESAIELNYCLEDQFSITRDLVLGSTFVPHIGIMNDFPVEVEHNDDGASIYAYAKNFDIELSDENMNFEGILRYKGYPFNVRCNIF